MAAIDEKNVGHGHVVVAKLGPRTSTRGSIWLLRRLPTPQRVSSVVVAELVFALLP